MTLTVYLSMMLAIIGCLGLMFTSTRQRSSFSAYSRKRKCLFYILVSVTICSLMVVASGAVNLELFRIIDGNIETNHLTSVAVYIFFVCSISIGLLIK